MPKELKELSKNNRALLHAHKKGYKVNKKGEVIGPRKNKLKLRKKEGMPGHYYLIFSVKFEGMSYPVKVHRLAAYQKFGDKMFEEGMEIAHIDDVCDNNSSKNLLLTTHQENIDHKKIRHKNHKGETVIDDGLKINQNDITKAIKDMQSIDVKDVSDYLGSN